MDNKKKLIEKECANYIDGQCIYYNLCYCIELSSIRKKDKHCKYYLDSILPLDEELQNKELTEVKEGYRKRCERCDKLFYSKSKNRKYCKECAKERYKKSHRKASLKYNHKKNIN